MRAIQLSGVVRMAAPGADPVAVAIGLCVAGCCSFRHTCLHAGAEMSPMFCLFGMRAYGIIMRQILAALAEDDAQ